MPDLQQTLLFEKHIEVANDGDVHPWNCTEPTTIKVYQYIIIS